MVRVSIRSVLKLVVFYHVFGYAIGNTSVVELRGKKFHIPLDECKNAKRWYKNGEILVRKLLQT